MSMKPSVVLVIVIVCLPFTIAAQSTVSVSIEDLGTLGGERSVAYDINNRGEVVGLSTNAVGEERAFLWTRRTGMIDLGLPFGAGPADINNRGQVVGQYFLGAESRAFSWSARTGFVDLGAGGAGSINDRGQIAGFCGGGGSPARACLYIDGAWVELGGTWTEALAINNSAEVVGVGTGTDDYLHAFYWSAATGLIELPGLGQSTGAAGINEAGTIVGWSTPAVLGIERAVIWQDHQLLNLGLLGNEGSRGNAVNSRGQVVGESRALTGGLHAFLWTEERGMLDLGTLGGHDSTAYDINSRGQVVGYSQIPTGERRATLWTVQ